MWSTDRHLIYLVTFLICNVDLAISNVLLNATTTSKLNMPPWNVQMQNVREYLCPETMSDPASCNLVNNLISRILNNDVEKLRIVNLIINNTHETKDLQSQYDFYSFFGDTILNSFILRAAHGRSYGLYLLFYRAIQSGNVVRVTDLLSQLRKQLRDLKTCSTTGLSKASRSWIWKHIFLTLIPSVGNDIDVFSRDFGYAMAAQVFLQKFQLTLPDITFDELIQLSEGIEYFARYRMLDQSVLSIFAIPALIQYTHEHMDNNSIALDFQNGMFKWNVAYVEMFTKFERIKYDTIWRYNSAMASYRNRSALAAEFIKRICKGYDLATEIIQYKNYGSDYKCPEGRVEEMDFPDISEVFLHEITDIADKYKALEEMLIVDHLRYQKDVRSIASSFIYKASIELTKIKAYYYPDVGPIYDERLKHLLDDSADLFVSLQSGGTKWKFYAIVRDNSEMKILSYDENNSTQFYESIMKKAISQNLVNSSDNFTMEMKNEVLKYPYHNITMFARNVARGKANLVRETLYNTGFGETTWEKTMGILVSAIPFHDCYKKVTTSRYIEGGLDCTVDILSFIPVIGEIAKVGITIFEKTAAVVLKSFAKEIGFKSVQSALAHIAAAVGESITWSNAKIIGISLLRSFDIGFELLFTLSKSMLVYLTELGRSLPIFKRIAGLLNAKYEKMISKLKLEYINEEAVLKLETKKTLSIEEMTSMLSRCRQKGKHKRDVFHQLDYISPERLIIDSFPECTVQHVRSFLKMYFFPNALKELEFAQEFAETRIVPEWASTYRLRYPEWVYGTEITLNLETPEHYETARQAIRKLYSDEEILNIGVDLTDEKFFKNYRFHSTLGEHHISIEDYFAIRNYGKVGGFEKINEATKEASLMRDAMRRMTIRTSTRLNQDLEYEGYVRITLSDTDDDLFIALQKTADEHFSKRFTPLSTEWGEVEAELEEVEEGMRNVIVHFEIDSEWLVTDLQHIYKDQLLLHPNVPLIVQDIEEIDDTEVPYLFVTIVNERVDKHEKIPEIMEEIENDI